jgi:hypothetical protein
MTPPKVIYLQLYDAFDEEELIPGKDEITWCEDKINPKDVRYILDPNVTDVEEYYEDEE